MKPGMKSTEFYVVMIVMIMLAALEAFQAEISDGAAIGMGIAAGLYAAARAYCKRQEEVHLEITDAADSDGETEEETSE